VSAVAEDRDDNEAVSPQINSPSFMLALGG